MTSQIVCLNVMMAIQCKRTVPLDLIRPLRSYIKKAFSEKDAVDAEDDLAALQALRDKVEKGCESLEASKEALLAYYRALTVMGSRFPISPDAKHINNVSFTWMEAFRPSKKTSAQNVHFEKAAVLFNLGATYSQLALAADRSTPEGIKLACNLFQSAAGAFLYLKEHVALKASVGGAGSVDVSAECSGMLERLMLGQAQECFFEKAVADGKSNSLCAKVAEQVGMFYEEAHAAIILPPLSSHFERPWVANIQIKASHFHAEALYRKALDLRKEEDGLVEDIAEEIALLRGARDVLYSARKNGKGVMQPLMDAVIKLEGAVQRNLAKAEEENDKVYIMRLAPLSSFPPIQPTALVKAANVEPLLDATKETLFMGIVPDSSTKELSKYTDMVDSLIRTEAEKLQRESELAKVRLKEMGLPDLLHVLEGDVSSLIPSKLREDVEAIIISGSMTGLNSSMAQLRDLRRVSEELLAATEDVLEREAKQDAEMRGQMGARWTRPASASLTKYLRERATTFAKNLKQARDNDAKIEATLRDASDLLALLNCNKVDDMIPRISQPMVSIHGDDNSVAGNLQHLLSELQKVGSHRAALEDMLKEMKQKENVLPQLMNSAGSHDQLFKRELAKYDPIKADIQRNIAAQQQLLQQIQIQNDIFYSTFNIPDYKASVDRSLKQVEAAVVKYQELAANANEGLKFYVAMQEAIEALKQQCSDFAMTRSIQSQEMVNDLQQQLAGLSFAPHAASAPAPSQPQPPAAASAPQQQQQQQQRPQHQGGGGGPFGFLQNLPLFQAQKPPAANAAAAPVPAPQSTPYAAPAASQPAYHHAPHTQPPPPANIPGQYYQPQPSSSQQPPPPMPHYYAPSQSNLAPGQGPPSGSYYAPGPQGYGVAQPMSGTQWTGVGQPAPQGYSAGPPPTGYAQNQYPQRSDQQHYQFPPGY